MTISIIVIIAKNNVIGQDNAMPWHLPADLKHFKHTTMGHPIIMGRKTFDALKKALPGRTNIVVTRQSDFKAEGCITAHALDEAIDIAKTNHEKEVFIIGGAQIYKQALLMADKIYLTRIHADFDGDIFFPEYDQDDWKIIKQQDMRADEKNFYDYSFLILEKRKDA